MSTNHPEAIKAAYALANKLQLNFVFPGQTIIDTRVKHDPKTKIFYATIIYDNGGEITIGFPPKAGPHKVHVLNDFI